MDYIPPAYVEPVGDPKFPRYVFRDSGGSYFTSDGNWREDPRAAAVYYSVADAIADERRYSDGQHLRDTYTVKLVVVTDKDAWTRDELVQHLTRFTEIIVHKNQERRGVVIETHWNGLHKTE